MMWLLDLMVTFPKSKTRIHISEKCVRFIGTCINTRQDKIDKAGLSLKVTHNHEALVNVLTRCLMLQEKFKPFMCIVPLNLREFYRLIKGRHLVVAPETEVGVSAMRHSVHFSISKLLHSRLFLCCSSSVC